MKDFFERLYDPDDLLIYRSFSKRRGQPTTAYFRLHHLDDYPSLKDKTKDHYFGVCPRFGPRGEYDRAHQIRKVPVLWADLDWPSGPWELDWSAYDLPIPTYVVFSGRGCHAYWKLKTPILIDDVGDPEPVAAGVQHRGVFSPKSLKTTALLRRIAKACRGDHTHDLPRILRIPGTYNTKTDPPTQCSIWQYTHIDHDVSDFEHLPEIKTKQQVIEPTDIWSDTTLPAALGLAIMQSISADPGRRSEADFATCRMAISHGVDRERLWSAVKRFGKFKDRGRTYFDKTFDRAGYTT